ncbi:unnamed protein product [Paramecium primaurelia]|uniref:Uncharacterized protein n=1 Tax=Paramecium primaurelia TaxID=5886 RepID=A0A8S1QM30_PARPR|nr:unnamed protein product [Paramecium primaurelia]
MRYFYLSSLLKDPISLKVGCNSNFPLHHPKRDLFNQFLVNNVLKGYGFFHKQLQQQKILDFIIAQEDLSVICRSLIIFQKQIGIGKLKLRQKFLFMGRSMNLLDEKQVQRSNLNLQIKKDQSQQLQIQNQIIEDLQDKNVREWILMILEKDKDSLTLDRSTLETVNLIAPLIPSFDQKVDQSTNPIAVSRKQEISPIYSNQLQKIWRQLILFFVKAKLRFCMDLCWIGNQMISTYVRIQLSKTRGIAYKNQCNPKSREPMDLQFFLLRRLLNLVKSNVKQESIKEEKGIEKKLEEIGDSIRMCFNQFSSKILN